VSRHKWTEDEVRALGVRTDLVTACEIIYGTGRTKAYQLLHAGELDFPVYRAGARYTVPTAPLITLLCLSEPAGLGSAPERQPAAADDLSHRLDRGRRAHDDPPAA
jgi:hypothetical protein